MIYKVSTVTCHAFHHLFGGAGVVLEWRGLGGGGGRVSDLGYETAAYPEGGGVVEWCVDADGGERIS